jgi:hypothetical protein
MWINYETELLKRNELAKLFLDSIDFETAEREKYGLIGRTASLFERFRVNAERMVIAEIDRIEKLQNQDERLARMSSLREALDSLSAAPDHLLKDDAHNYLEKIKDQNNPCLGLTAG